MNEVPEDDPTHPAHPQGFILMPFWSMGFSGGASGKEPTCQCRRCKRHRLDPWVGWGTSCRRKRQPSPVFLPGEPHGQRSLAGCRVEHDCSDSARALWRVQSLGDRTVYLVTFTTSEGMQSAGKTGEAG